MSLIKEILNNKEALEETTKAMFNDADTDNSGTISIEELEALFQRLSEEWGIPCPSKENIKSGLDAIDQNKDGVLSLSEFKTLVVDVLTVLADLE